MAPHRKPRHGPRSARAQAIRAQKLKAVQEMAASGRLVIRQMTDAERERFGVPPR